VAQVLNLVEVSFGDKSKIFAIVAWLEVSPALNVNGIANHSSINLSTSVIQPSEVECFYAIWI
jgi:hypothetical protein